MRSLVDSSDMILNSLTFKVLNESRVDELRQ